MGVDLRLRRSDCTDILQNRSHREAAGLGQFCDGSAVEAVEPGGVSGRGQEQFS